QKNLLTWTSIYSKIKQHPDCPSDELIEDDDALDGWMILQGEKSEQERFKAEIDKKLQNPKIANADEVYLMADNTDYAKKIEGLNDNVAAFRKKQRMAELKRKGTMQEMEFTDTKNMLMEKARNAR